MIGSKIKVLGCLICSIAFWGSGITVASAEDWVDTILGDYVPSEVEAHYKKQIAEYEKLAKTGDAEALYQLARHYDYGWGVKPNSYVAANFYERAAVQGHVDAQHSLGLLYDCVLHLPQKSVKWFRMAAEQGHVSSQHFLGKAYEEGVGCLRDYRLAVKWYQKAAEQGNGLAMHSLASLYERGLGVKRDLAKAYAWNNIAAAQGWGLARAYREKLESAMSQQQIEEAQKLSKELLKTYRIDLDYPH